jgi:hypothetical protein
MELFVFLKAISEEQPGLYRYICTFIHVALRSKAWSREGGEQKEW